MVEYQTNNPNIDGLNPDAVTRRERKCTRATMFEHLTQNPMIEDSNHGNVIGTKKMPNYFYNCVPETQW